MESKFGVGVGSLEWFDEKNLWSLTGLDGQNLGNFEGVVASDKNIFSKRFTDVTGRPPPLGKCFPSLFWSINIYICVSSHAHVYNDPFSFFYFLMTELHLSRNNV